jgi:hypothetical protein
MRRVWASGLLLCVVAAACSDEGGAAPDGGPPPPVDAGPDVEHGACREVATPSQRVTGLPSRIAGSLTGAGADMVSPRACAEVVAPFGTVSAGPDQVVAIDGLSPGAEYTVRLESDEDLSFYVVTGCSSEGGPTAGECLLFVDETTERVEVGRFVAPATTAYVVVDYFASRELGSGDFAIDVYAAGCDGADDCGGATPACVDNRCVECVTSFDCTDPARPVCDGETYTCRAGGGSCIGDDSDRDNGDDGPAGAVPLPLSGTAGRICNDPLDEQDFFRFDVAKPGEHWQLLLSGVTGADLDLFVYDAGGAIVGMSRFEDPEGVFLTFLPVGRYYVAVDWADAQPYSTAVPYALAAVGASVDVCATDHDCALEYRNQAPRGACVGGACTRIDGDGEVPVGGACDSQSDCAAGSACPSFLFTADADQRSHCGLLCTADGDCASMGQDFVCTTYLPQNFCVPRCTRNDHCPTFADVAPEPGEPWARYRCQTSTGRCVR